MIPNRLKSIVINIAVWLGLTVLVGALGSIGALRSSSISRHFESTKGTGIGLLPFEHQSFDYSYWVGRTIYTGRSTAANADRKLETMKVGDTVTIFYDTSLVDSSTAGPPDMPGIEATSKLIGAC